MTLDLFLITDLKLVEAEVVFEFVERFFNAPAQEVIQDGVFGRDGEVVGDEDMDIFVIGVRPFIEDEKDLQISGTVFEFGFESIDERVFDLAIFLRDFDVFETVDEMLFEERNNLIGAHILTEAGLGVSEKDRAVDFSFRDEGKHLGMDEFNHLRRSIPGIEEDG